MVFDIQTVVLLGIIFLLLVLYGRKAWPSKTSKQDKISRLERQLDAIKGIRFQRKKIMNDGEFWAFKILEDGPIKARPGLRIFAQVSLGEILRAKGHDTAFAAINAKRVDLLIVDRDGTPLLAVEYQGPGHNQDEAETRLRDQIKKEALRSAGVEYLEGFPGKEELIHNGALELLDQVRRNNGTYTALT